MDATTEATDMVPVVFGRFSKKRKAYRQRGGDGAAAPDTTEPQLPTTTSPTPKNDSVKPSDTPRTTEASKTKESDTTKPDDTHENDQNDDEQGADNDQDETDEPEEVEDEDADDAVGVAVAELIRRRKQRKLKMGGVGFRNDRRLVPSRVGDLDMDDMDLDLSEPVHMGMRFAPPTGLIGDAVNRHMEEYVEAQLAKRQQQQADATAKARSAGRGGAGSGLASIGGPASTAGLSAEARKQHAMKGKLHEIDLGTEAKQRNIAMTQRATQQLGGTTSHETPTGTGDDAAAAGAHTKLGRNGKPYRPKPKPKRRASDDVERDQIVEQFLHENKMDVDVYDVPLESGPVVEGRPTDDRIAEQFRREFMEAAALRKRRKHKPLGPPPKPKTRNDEEVLKGPKLGGSRNVRSVMRDKLLQKQEEQRQSVPKYEQELLEQRRRQSKRR